MGKIDLDGALDGSLGLCSLAGPCGPSLACPKQQEFLAKCLIIITLLRHFLESNQ